MDTEISPNGSPIHVLTVIIPARNEAASIRNCLSSLVSQSEDDFLLGRDWSLIVVDDGSTDETRSIAQEFPGITLLEAPPLVSGWTGKNNALWFAAQHAMQAQPRCLLFTDADTVHEPGNLRRAVHEAERYHAALLTYSPRQMVHGFGQRALMPLIFADLAQTYPPKLVNSSNSGMAAANGQFLLFESALYRSVGGHQAVRNEILEDMELACRVKQADGGIRLRYAPDALSVRMYRGFGEMWNGWRKNLALLFPDALSRGLGKMLQSLLLFGLPLLAVWMYLTVARTELIWAVLLWWVWRMGVHYTRVARAHFSGLDTALSIFGLPLFTVLLLDAWLQKILRRPVAWKGRTYPG